jgi:hypothetical protein
MSKIVEDIDFIEFLLLIWKGKWTILAFTLIASISGGAFTSIKIIFEGEKEPIFESEIFYAIETIPPINTIFKNYETQKVFSDFQKLYYEKEIFDSWKNLNKESELTYENFTNTKILKGITVMKENKNRLTIFRKRDKKDYIYIKSNKFSKINDIFNYSNHVNNKLASKYINLTKREYESMVQKLNKFNEAFSENPKGNFVYELMNYEEYLTQLTSLEAYIDQVKGGAQAIHIHRPTAPKKLNDMDIKNTYFKILIYAIVGFMIGIFFIFTLNTIRKRK